GQRLDSREHAGPSLLPLLQQRLPCRGWIHEFMIAITGRLLTIARQKIRPSRSHIARDVLDDGRDRICLFIERREELLIRNLRHRSFAKLLVLSENRQCVFDKRRCEFQSHRTRLLIPIRKLVREISSVQPPRYGSSR